MGKERVQIPYDAIANNMSFWTLRRGTNPLFPKLKSQNPKSRVESQCTLYKRYKSSKEQSNQKVEIVAKRKSLLTSLCTFKKARTAQSQFLM